MWSAVTVIHFRLFSEAVSDVCQYEIDSVC